MNEKPHRRVVGDIGSWIPLPVEMLRQFPSTENDPTNQQTFLDQKKFIVGAVMFAVYPFTISAAAFKAFRRVLVQPAAQFATAHPDCYRDSQKCRGVARGRRLGASIVAYRDGRSCVPCIPGNTRR